MSDNIVIDIVENVTNVNVGLSTTSDNFEIDAFPGGAVWGNVVGTLSAQSDLWSYLSAETFSPSQLTAFLATNSLTLCSIDVRGLLLSAGVDLFDIFLTSETDSQTLSYTPSSYELSISNGNTVNLSSINSLFGSVSGKYEDVYSSVTNTSGNWNHAYNVSIVYQSVSSSFATNTLLQSTSSLLTPLTLTNDLTGQLVLNTDFDSYRTDVAASTATLLPATIYQEASGNWQNTYNTVQTNSATTWNYQGTDLKELSSNWQNTFTNVQSNSANWNTAYETATVYQTNSATYATNITLQSVSSLLTPLTLTNNLTSQLVLNTNFSNYQTSVASATAILLPTSIYQEASGTWQNASTNVQSNSANWNTAFDRSTVFSSVSSRYNSTSTAVESNSANWNFGYDVATYVQANSADWEESAEILPTVTNYLSTNNVLISSLNVFTNIFTNTLSVSSKTVLSNQLYYTTDNKVTQLLPLSGNYDEGQFLGRTKLTQNNTRLINVGNTWTPKESNRSWWGVAMSSDGKYQTAVVSGGQIYISSDYGNTWVPKESNRSWSEVAMSSDGKYQTVPGYFENFVYISNDYGNTWVPKGYAGGGTGITMSSDGKYQTIVTQGQIYISSNYGNTWIPKESSFRIWSGVAMSSDGKYQTAVVENGLIYISSDYGNTWVPKESNRFWYSVAMSSDGKYQTVTVSGGQIYISSDYGNTWVPKESNRSWLRVAMSSDGKYQTVTVSSGQIYISKANELIDGSLTVTNISSTNIVYAQGGNSNQWNSAYTTVQSNSSNWDNAYNTGTVYQANSASYATNTSLQSVSSLLTPLTLTNNLTSQLVLNTDFDSYRTDVASVTATLLSTSIYQQASGNWQDTYTTVQANSADWEESAEILPTVTNYLSTNNVLLSTASIADNLTVFGQISATGTIYAQQGNSGQWISKTQALAFSIAL